MAKAVDADNAYEDVPPLDRVLQATREVAMAVVPYIRAAVPHIRLAVILLLRVLTSARDHMPSKVWYYRDLCVCAIAKGYTLRIKNLRSCFHASFPGDYP